MQSKPSKKKWEILLSMAFYQKGISFSTVFENTTCKCYLEEEHRPLLIYVIELSHRSPCETEARLKLNGF